MKMKITHKSVFKFSKYLVPSIKYHIVLGAIASGKTTSAKLLCHKLSKCPYFVKIIWINGRFLAGN